MQLYDCRSSLAATIHKTEHLYAKILEANMYNVHVCIIGSYLIRNSLKYIRNMYKYCAYNFVLEHVIQTSNAQSAKSIVSNDSNC